MLPLIVALYTKTCEVRSVEILPPTLDPVSMKTVWDW
jgi:hypothetical protein